MFDHERLISLCGQATDVPKLLRVPDDNGTLSSIEKRQCRGNITLARFVNHNEVEFSRYEWYPSACR
jgi:hypothetical protein